MKSSPEKVLVEGLEKSFSRKLKLEDTERGGVVFSVVHMEDGDVSYHDEFIDGGGQELAKSGENTLTRVYGGSTIPPKELAKLGITVDDVLKQLVKQVKKLGATTRLYVDSGRQIDGRWQYEYQIKERYPQIPLTIGVETITYKGQLVFVHGFLICPVR